MPVRHSHSSCVENQALCSRPRLGNDTGRGTTLLVGADRIRRVMGDTGIRILVRIMGLLLVALAVQFFVNGLTDLGVIARQ